MPKASQASFARELNELVPTSDGDCTTTVDGRRMGDFMKKKGPQAGASTMAFYAAYVYFEKMRLKDGKKKSKKRQEMVSSHRVFFRLNVTIRLYDSKVRCYA